MKTVYQFNLFNREKITHGFTRKAGGVSKGMYKSANFISSTGDSKENVSKNFSLLGKKLDIPISSMVSASQTHETNILEIENHHKGMGIIKPRDFSHIDGFISSTKNIALITYHADCVPLFFYDEKLEVIGLAHSGWRGVCSSMAEKMVESLEKTYHSNASDILCGIGPSIKSCCFQVSEDLLEAFDKEGKDIKKFVKNDREEGKYLVDLQGIIKESLINYGLKEENIEVSSDCTKCMSDTYFSHRKVGRNRGSMVGIIMMKE